MTYNIVFVSTGLVNEKEIVSCEQASESVVSDAVFEDQQCQMKCKQDCFADVDNFQDAVPVAYEYVSSSTFGARGSIAQSVLLPSDADQMLRVRTSMSRSHQDIHTYSNFFAYLRDEAYCMPHCVLNELCTQYPNITQVLRI